MGVCSSQGAAETHVARGVTVLEQPPRATGMGAAWDEAKGMVKAKGDAAGASVSFVDDETMSRWVPVDMYHSCISTDALPHLQQSGLVLTPSGLLNTCATDGDEVDVTGLWSPVPAAADGLSTPLPRPYERREVGLEGCVSTAAGWVSEQGSPEVWTTPAKWVSDEEGCSFPAVEGEPETEVSGTIPHEEGSPVELHNGWMEKKGQELPVVGSAWRRRWFRLEPHVLHYFTEDQRTTAGRPSHPASDRKGSIRLTNAVCSANWGCGVTIEGPHLSRAFELKAPSDAAAREWLAKLVEAGCVKHGGSNASLPADTDL